MPIHHFILLALQSWRVSPAYAVVMGPLPAGSSIAGLSPEAMINFAAGAGISAILPITSVRPAPQETFTSCQIGGSDVLVRGTAVNLFKVKYST